MSDAGTSALALLLFACVISVCSAAIFLGPGGSDLQIPRHIIMTGAQDTIDELPAHIQSNIRNTKEVNPEMEIKYFSDSDCRRYVRQHCDDDVADMYIKEKHGPFRGDICRAAILLHEGGFYADVDLEAKVPFRHLVDNATSLMSVFTKDGAVLNALMAVVPGHPVMKKTIQEMVNWNQNRGSYTQSDGQWFGTVTLRRAMKSFMKESCPSEELDNVRQSPFLQWPCGNQAFRFYHEAELRCWRKLRRDIGECPSKRRNSRFVGLKMGIFTPNEPRQLIAWPRVASCQKWWCGAGI